MSVYMLHASNNDNNALSSEAVGKLQLNAFFYKKVSRCLLTAKKTVSKTGGDPENQQPELCCSHLTLAILGVPWDGFPDIYPE